MFDDRRDQGGAPRPNASGDTTPCRMTGVTSQAAPCGMTGVILHMGLYPQNAAIPVLARDVARPPPESWEW